MLNKVILIGLVGKEPEVRTALEISNNLAELF